MEGGDRSKKNLTKGGARPKEHSQNRYRHFQPNRVFRAPDSDSSDYYREEAKDGKKSQKKATRSHSLLTNYAGLDVCRSSHKSDKKRRKFTNLGGNVSSSGSRRSSFFSGKYDVNQDICNTEFVDARNDTNMSNIFSKTHRSLSDFPEDSKNLSRVCIGCGHGICDRCRTDKTFFSCTDDEARSCVPEFKYSKVPFGYKRLGDVDRPRNLQIHSGNYSAGSGSSFRKKSLPSERKHNSGEHSSSCENSYWTDCDSSGKGRKSPQKPSKHKKHQLINRFGAHLKHQQYSNKIINTDVNTEQLKPSNNVLRSLNFLKKSSFVDGTSTLIGKPNNIPHNPDQKFTKGKSKPGRRKKSRSHLACQPLARVQDKCNDEESSSLSSSSLELGIKPVLNAGDDDFYDSSATWDRDWNFDVDEPYELNMNMTPRPLADGCRFTSSSSSEADDEFECDCSYCFHNPGSSHHSQLELVRSMFNDRSELSEQLFVELFDVPSILPHEPTWDAIVQELAEQIRRFSVDIDLFSSVSTLTNSDFEALPTAVPSESQESQTCTICLSTYEEEELAKVLPCSHSFHVQCIKVWLAKSSTCPVCRDVVRKKR